MKKLLLLPLLVMGLSSFCQTLSKTDLEKITERHWQHGLSLLQEIISMPNDAAFPEQMAVNITWSEKKFSERGHSTG